MKHNEVTSLLLFTIFFLFMLIFGVYYHTSLKRQTPQLENTFPPPPDTSTEVIWDWKNEQWVPLRKGGKADLDEKALRRAKTIDFDSMEYDPEFDPLHEPDPK